MDYQLYTEVVLVHDLPEEHLFAGDVGTVVERHDVAGMDTALSFLICLGKQLRLLHYLPICSVYRHLPIDPLSDQTRLRHSTTTRICYHHACRSHRAS